VLASEISAVGSVRSARDADFCRQMMFSGAERRRARTHPRYTVPPAGRHFHPYKLLALTAQSAEQALCNGHVPIRLFQSHRSTASSGVRRSSLMLSVRRAGRRYQSTTASGGRPAATAPQHGAQQQMRAVTC